MVTGGDDNTAARTKKARELATDRVVSIADNMIVQREAAERLEGYDQRRLVVRPWAIALGAQALKLSHTRKPDQNERPWARFHSDIRSNIEQNLHDGA